MIVDESNSPTLKTILNAIFPLIKQAHYYEDETALTGTCAVCVVGGER